MSAIMLAASLIFADPPAKPRVQWVVYGATWCSPCSQAKADYEPWFRRSGWRVGPAETDHIRTIDIDRNADAADAAEIQTVPTFVLIVEGREVRRFVAYPGRGYMAREYLRQHERLR